jgi:hypothetical protein
MVSALMGTALALCAGCAAGNDDGAGNGGQTSSTPAPEDTASATAFLVLNVEDGHTIGFYEQQPGALMVIENMREGQTSILNQHQGIDAIALFNELRPNEAVPATLTAAYERAKALATTPGAIPLDNGSGFGGGSSVAKALAAAKTTSTGNIGVTSQAITSSSNPDDFVNSGGGCDWANRASICRINWSNGFFAFANPSGSATCIVDHYAGNGITVQLTAGSTVLPTFQAVGTVATYSWGIVSGSILRRMDILNASGDQFHAGCRFFN